jgi:anti-anti-sigma factor
MTDGPNDGSQRSELLQVQRRANGTGVVVHVAGELDLLTASGLVGELTTARTQARTPGPLVIDLTDVTFIASVGLSILIVHNRLCREEDVELRVVAGNRMVARTINRTGLDDVLAVFTTLAEALAPAN